MILVFLLLLAAVAGAWYWADTLEELGPGYILIYYNHYSIETSFWICLLILILLVVVLYGLIRLSSISTRYMIRLGFLPRSFSLKKARKKQYLGTLAYLDKRWLEASELLSQAAMDSETPFLHYMMAIQASIEVGDKESAEEFYVLAEKLEDADELSLALVKLDIAALGSDTVETNNQIKALRNDYPSSKRVLATAMQAYLSQKNWQALDELIPALNRYKVVAQERLDEIRAQVAAQLLQQAADNDDKQGLQELWKRYAKQHRDEAVARAYFSAMIKFNHLSDVEKQIQQLLKKQWQTHLIDLYSSFSSDKGLQQQWEYAFAFYDTHKQDPAYLAALGKLALRMGEADKAKEYLSQSVSIQADSETYLALMSLHKQNGDHRLALQYAQEAMQ